MDDINTETMTTALAELAKVTPTLPDDIDALIATGEIQAAMQQYCEHSGKPCGKADYNQTRAMLAVHGKRTTLKILKTQQQQVSLEWIWLNAEGLQALAQHQPREFFVYICQKLLQAQTIGLGEKRFTQTVDAFAQLQTIADVDLNPLNEMMRRLLGMSCQQNINTLLKRFKRYALLDIIKSVETLADFKIDLQAAITTIIEGRKKKRFAKEGASLYRSMQMIAALSELEMSIGNEFNDFDLVEGKTAEVIAEILGGNKKVKPRKKLKFNSVSKQKTGVFKLKLGGSPQ